MQKRGLGNKSGREASRARVEALTALEECLRDVDFPIHLDDLLDSTEGVVCFRSANGDEWSVPDLLTDVPVPEFSSARHVLEVVRLRIEDMADLFRPGGHGAHQPYGPSEERVEGDETERAVAAHDEAMGEERDPRAGPGPERVD